MGNDDVRARAEAVLAGLDLAAEIVMPSIHDSRDLSLKIDALRAALAVAPATSQPVAWAVFADGGARLVSLFHYRDSACSAAGSASGRDEGWCVVPLYAAPPATAQPVAWALKSPMGRLYRKTFPTWEDAEGAAQAIHDRDGEGARPTVAPLYAATAPSTAVVGSVSDQGSARVEESRSDDRPASGQGGV